MRYVIAGTGVNSWVGRIYYAKILKRLDAELICLPHLGLLRSVDWVGYDLACMLYDKHRKTQDPVTLIGHSQGGLAALEAQRWCQLPNLKVATVGAPLAGSQWASSLSPLPPIRDMAANSVLLETLYGWDKPENLHIYLEHDALVMPFGGEDRVSDIFQVRTGHIASMWSDGVIKTIQDWMAGQL